MHAIGWLKAGTRELKVPCEAGWRSAYLAGERPRFQVRMALGKLTWRERVQGSMRRWLEVSLPGIRVAKVPCEAGWRSSTWQESGEGSM